MRKIIAMCGILAATFAAPSIAFGQGITRGAAEGADTGAHAAGPVGAVVGGVVGGVTGAVGGLIGVDQQPRFRTYVLNEHHPSRRWGGRVVVGGVLPSSEFEYWDVPPDYGPAGYRYTIINDEIVLVDPRTMRIVEVIG